MGRQYIPNTYWDFGNYMNTYYLPPQWGGWASIVPIQPLVDAYWNRDGSSFSPISASDRKIYYNDGNPDERYYNEFKNRDPRLYASLVFTGAKMNAPSGVREYKWIEDPDNLVGYVVRKLVDVNSDQGDGVGSQDFSIIRYAEVLLTFAEAQNEAGGPDAEVYAALNDIRDRAGMPAVDQAKYGTKESLRELIRNERRIELAFEGQRYFDIRRWGIAGDVMKTVYSVNNTLAQSREWKDHYKLMPYPQSAVDHNPNLASFQKDKGY